MSTASELLIQAQKLHSLQSYISVQAAQTPLHFATQQELAHKTTGSVSTPMATQQLPGNLQTAEAAQHEGVSANSERTAAAAEGDMAAIALDVVESQLPQWASRNSLDWSAQQDLSVHQPQIQLRYEPAGDLPIMRKFSFEERGEEIEVQPMWVLVHQEKPDGPARLYETVHRPTPEMLQHISAVVEPFCFVEEDMTFSNPQFSHGPWKGYRVGAVGVVAAHEDDALWPNRLFCGKRVMHNVRHGWDIAKFLSEPRIEDMAGHHANLKLIQEDRQYQPGWVWRMLSSRWGEDAMVAYSKTMRPVQQKVERQMSRLTQFVPKPAFQSYTGRQYA